MARTLAEKDHPDFLARQQNDFTQSGGATTILFPELRQN
jgi:hypothetical protein